MTLGKIKNVMRRTAGELVYFVGSIPSDKIKLTTFVAAIEPADNEYLQYEVKESNYQRPGAKSRMNTIKKFFENHPNRLIPPIILSGRGKWIFQGAGEIGELQIESEAAIIDGQHRAGGLVALYEQNDEVRHLDFVCFEDLDVQEEIDEFVTINGEQRKVPIPLNRFLTGDEGAKIAWELNKAEGSPFKGKIYRIKASPLEFFALHSMEKNVKASFNHGALEGLGFKDKVDALMRYWKLIARHNQEAWQDIERPKRQQEKKLCELTGIIAWSEVAPQFLMKGWAPQTQTFNWEIIEQLVKSVSEDFDWDKNGEYVGLTGYVGGRRIAKALESALGMYRD